MDLRKSYYKDVDAAVVVVDLSDQESIELAGTWKQDIVNHAVITNKKTEKQSDGTMKVVTEYTKADPKDIPVLLLGNKYDIIEEKERLRKIDENDEIRSDDFLERTIAFTVKNNAMESGLNMKTIDTNGDVNSSDSRSGSKTTKTTDEDEYYKPVEVVIMEEIAELHGFVGSVMVSAKEADGSVHTALQSLLRHLIERKLKHKALEKMELQQKKRLKKKKRVKVAKNDSDFEAFEEVDIPEFDELFQKCNIPVRRAHEDRDSYLNAVKKFKVCCADADIVSTPSASMEDCISGLREIIGNPHDFMAVDDNDFLQLVVKGESSLKVPIRKALKTFHSDVVVSCKIILRDCPKIETMLEDLDEQIDTTADDAWNLATKYGKTHKNVKNILQVVDKNRARIKNARSAVSQNLQDVDNTNKKVKAAIMWSQEKDTIKED
ncbi:uncharacterized protein LOC102808369 [Saccoglossus kowalevskii]|uniref:Uncharacterized protein LOC102808369 n=1 Tax=Saccoglossus kowalevskii TaxID=10224 RepID=A0ABM0LYK0_SACKO|nr:PREDICTED: uncharacterized protein LOC102808369 [Saccoglossus kowalevskii]